MTFNLITHPGGDAAWRATTRRGVLPVGSSSVVVVDDRSRPKRKQTSVRSFRGVASNQAQSRECPR